MSAQRAGFTIVELVIVVVILAIIMAIAVPRVSSANENAVLNAAAADFRQLELAFRMYHADHGGFPPNRPYGDHPAPLEPYYAEHRWEAGPAIGDVWDWNPDIGPIQPHISMYAEEHDETQILRFDARFDDGNLDTGSVRHWDNHHLGWQVAP